LALRKQVGQCPTLEDEPRGCGAALVCTSWGKISNLLEGSKVRVFEHCAQL